MLKIEKEKVIAVAKTATMIISGIACAAVVTAAIKNMLPVENVTKYNKVMFGIGTILISSLVADQGAIVAGNLFDAFVTIPTMTGEELVKAANPEEIKE